MKTEKIRVIAEYDGWYEINVIEHESGQRTFVKLFKDETKYRLLSQLPYLTSLDWLHPVAMNVMDALTDIFNKSGHIGEWVKLTSLESDIKRACYIRSINGEYPNLFNAVYNGILFLNQ
jgi:hypothetical protein